MLLAGNVAKSEVDIAGVPVEVESRAAWQTFLQELPQDVPLQGVVHLASLDGHGVHATTAEMAHDTKQITSSALALLQGLLDTAALTVKALTDCVTQRCIEGCE